MSTTALFDMLSARAAADDNTALTDLLARIRKGSDGGSQPGMQDLIAQLAQDNPMLGVLAQHMAEQKQLADQRSVVAEMGPAETDVPRFEDESVTDGQADEPRNAYAELDQLRSRLQSAQNELSALRDREDILAEALGACCLCWGEDAQCRACRGRGRPGFSMPDEELFGEFVLPAVRMFRACRMKH